MVNPNDSTAKNRDRTPNADRIAVLGAGGQLGGELCRQLGQAAIPLDRATCDLNNVDRIADALVALRPSAIVNAAAYTKVDLAESQPDECYRINAEAVAQIAEACRRLDCPLVQVSSDYVFMGDPSRQVPFREADLPNPAGVYAKSKLEGERLAATCPRHIIVRTCGLYGRLPLGAKQGNFVETMLRLGRERDRLRVVGDQRCTPSYVPHVARAILFLLGLPASGTYHVVNGGSTTWHEFAGEIFRLASLNVAVDRITTADYNAPAPRPAYSVLDTGKYDALNGPRLPHWRDALTEFLLERSSP